MVPEQDMPNAYCDAEGIQESTANFSMHPSFMLHCGQADATKPNQDILMMPYEQISNERCTLLLCTLNCQYSHPTQSLPSPPPNTKRHL